MRGAAATTAKEHAHTLLHYITPNEVLRDTTFLIKTHNRPECLQALLASLASHAPWIHVIVASDSDKPDVDLAVVEAADRHFVESIEFLQLPVDSGVGYGRDALVNAAEKKGTTYSIMSDDDYIIPDRDLLPRMAQALLSLDADVVAPKRCDVVTIHNEKHHGLSSHRTLKSRKNCARGMVAAMMRTPDDELYIMADLTRRYADDRSVKSTSAFVKTSMPAHDTTGARLDCERSDLVQQFLIAKTDVLKGTWDPVLKNNDHYDAMLSLQKRGKRLFTCNKLQVAHKHSPKQNTEKFVKEYGNKRAIRWMALMPYFLKKHNLKSLWDEVGRRWSIDPDTGKVMTQTGMQTNEKTGVTTAKQPPAVRVLPGAASKKSMDQLMRNFNRYQPAWDRVEVTKGICQEKIINPCLKHITMWPHETKYPARAILNNGQAIYLDSKHKSCNPCKHKTVKSQKWEGGHLLATKCPVLQQLMAIAWPRPPVGDSTGDAAGVQVIPTEPTPQGLHLFYVVVSSSLSSKIMIGLSKQNKLHDSRSSMTLIFVHMGSDNEEDVDASTWEADSKDALFSAGITLHLLELGPPFGRSLGLRAGFSRAHKLAEEAGYNEEECVVFSLDVSMDLPPDFSKGVMKSVSCGASVYAPVCSKTDRWVEGGYGMFGLCLQDYNELVQDKGGWRESWWFRWGAEDVDMAAQLNHRFIVHRPRVANYRHLSHRSRSKNPGYYTRKNMYPDFLPVVPISEVEENQEMIQEIFAFISTTYPGTEFQETVWRTPSPPPLMVNFYSVWTIHGELMVVSCRTPKGKPYSQPKFRRTFPAEDPRTHSMAHWGWGEVR
jgi:hypothetical protein